MVYQLRKALYDLKQAPRAWFNHIETYFMKEGFQRCASEQTLFTKRSSEGHIIIVSIYVDDLIFTGDCVHLLFDFKRSMMKEFDMTDMGSMSYFLGIEVLQKEGGIFIYQKRYALEVLKKFGMQESKMVGTPIVPGSKMEKDKNGIAVDGTLFKQLVGSLFYLTSTKPDLMFITSLLSRYMASPTELHMQAAKRALRYLKGIVDYGIYYKHGTNNKLLAFTDNDYAGDIEDRKSTSGYVFMLSSAAISWSSIEKATNCNIVNYRGRVCSSCNQCLSSYMAKEDLGAARIADIMTKPLKYDAFVKLRGMVGMCEVSKYGAQIGSQESSTKQ
ncbi:uncharacterized protein LOC109838243 [Asparagus officinalis]|uniref:uncharacterized protein LOC109838243 n=1 Tax=Asparagus officinalis TaxID=4686 RepID=UPI00098DEB24|nr:uncharacterized protein LOC109838243 [Asparagus officinalis]